MVSAEILDKNCWSHWPQWECYGANVAGLVSTGLWFIVLLPQVLKNWYRRSVSGLSFLWAVSNFTASLVNLFFVFSVQVPLYVKVSAVYMPILELTILFQFFLYVPKPLTTKLLVLLVCLVAWGCLIELELNLPASRDKVQWVAIFLWCVETFPQILLNIKLQSTSGQATTSVLISLVGKTTDFLSTYGLDMPLPYVVMCYFSGSSAFINGFQVFYYGKDSWFQAQPSNSKNGDFTTAASEQEKLLAEQSLDVKAAGLTTRRRVDRCSRRYLVVMIVRIAALSYICIGLITFAVALYLRTMTYVALLGPVGCFLVVSIATEYYRLKRKGYLRRCEEAEQRLSRGIESCEWSGTQRTESSRAQRSVQ